MTQYLNFGLVGAGAIGRMHARQLAREIDGARLECVADVFADAARACAEANGVERWMTEWRELVADPKIDAVAVCSPPHTHADVVEAAAMAGKHIFCEKPIATTLADADRALAAVTRAGVKFQIGFQRRFDPNFARVKRAIVEGEIGAPHIAHLVSRDPEPPTPMPNNPGGTFFDMTIHDFDVARFFMGCEPVEICTFADAMIVPELKQYGDVDVAVMLLRFENGAIVTIDNHTHAAYGYDQRAEVIGSAGAIRIDNVFPDNAVLGNASGFHSARTLPYFLERYEHVYRAEKQVFVNCVREDAATPVGVADARMSLVMALAAKRSYLEKRPVNISEITS